MADSIFDTRANPNVTTTDTITNAAPDYYTKYLGGLSQAGQDAMANPNKVAELTDYQKAGWNAIPGAATSYQPGLNAATATANTAAAGAVPQIQDFMNPYTTNVVDEMARLQQQNMQRNLMPQLKAGFVGTGGLGSQRYANALGQTVSDAQSNLTGQQYAALSAAQKAAIDAALNNTQNQNQAARTQGDLATQEQTSGLAAANAMTKAGTEMQTYNQALIDAPMKTATNASALLRGYTVPGSTTTSKTGPLSKDFYAGSPLSQTLGVSSMLGALYGKPKGGSGIIGDVASYFGGAAGSAAKSLSDWWKSYNPSKDSINGIPNPGFDIGDSSYTPDYSGGSSPIYGGGNDYLYYDPDAGGGSLDPSYWDSIGNQGYVADNGEYYWE